MVAIVRIILIIAVVYFGIRVVDRFIIPYLFPNRRRGNDNDTTISGSENRKKRFSKEDGDYVDYEEMK
jgi:capsule polysaccharide export protein KpsE/RkpR